MALLLSVLQQSTGRVATILFAHRLGTALEPEAKMWRLAADVFNDASMVLDCLSPGFGAAGSVARTAVLAASSVLSALCGVAAGSAKASLSRHFVGVRGGGDLGDVCAVRLRLACACLCVSGEGADGERHAERLQPGDSDIPDGHAGESLDSTARRASFPDLELLGSPACH